MADQIKEDCPFHPINIPDDREIVETDNLKFPWEGDDKGYFLIKLEDGKICCGFVNSDHKMEVEFRGKDPNKIIKEIAKRKLCSDLQHMGYIASELMIAKECLEQDKNFVQR
jgi:hypothetical protein